MSKIKKITRKRVETSLHNLAVLDDESYVSDGVIVHNCRSILIPITIFEEFKPDTKVGKKNIESFIEESKGKGFSTQ